MRKQKVFNIEQLPILLFERLIIFYACSFLVIPKKEREIGGWCRVGSHDMDFKIFRFRFIDVFKFYEF